MSYVSHITKALIISFIVFFSTTSLITEHNNLRFFDLSYFWAGASLFTSGQNPYQHDLLNSQVSLFFSDANPHINIWHPPILFLYTFWFSYFNFDLLANLWLAFSIGIIFASILVLRQAQGTRLRHNNYQHYISCTVFLSLPAYYSLLYWGQVTQIVLIALTVFICLCYQDNSRIEKSWASGFILSITAFKPHLLFLLYFFVLLRSIKTGHFQTVLGLIIGITFQVALIQILTPNLIGQYLTAIQSPPLDWWNPTIAAWLNYFFLESHVTCTRWLMPILGILSFTYIFLRQNLNIKVSELILLSVILSLIFTPYAWLFDFILLTPVLAWLLFPISFAIYDKRSFQMTALILLTANIFGLTLPNMQQHFWYPIVILMIFTFKLKYRKALPDVSYNVKSGS